MKLIFCPKCYDVVKLRTDNPRSCTCGASGGAYLHDGLNAKIWGKAIPLGIDNPSFAKAIRNRPKSGMGARFTAFVIPEECDTITQENGE